MYLAQKDSGFISKEDSMKKYFYLLLSILIVFLSSCNPNNDFSDSSLDSFKESEGNTIIDSEEFYCIYKNNGTQVYYNIYNKNGEIVLNETTEHPLKINMLSDDIVNIEIGMGTGITTHKYYNIEKNIFSKEFSYVISDFEELVAYIDISKENPLENRRIIVQNIFDDKLFYKEFQLEFSNVDTPVIDSTFSNDGTSLTVTYLSGEKQMEISEVLYLDETKPISDSSLK